MRTDQLFFGLGSVSALVAVAAGAFGAHSLKGWVPEDLRAAFETGTRYQMYHALALTGHRWLGALTPLGGAAFLLGWLTLAARMLRGN